MNLNSIVSGAISAVNPKVEVTVRPAASGYTTAPSGKRTQNMSADLPTLAQLQPLDADEVKHMDSLNIQGVLKKAYLDGDWRGVMRVEQLGGDLVIIDGQTWRVVQVFEVWPDWCSVALCLQL